MMNLTKKQANEERIRIAMTAIENMPDTDDLETGIIDLITNLLHLAEQEGLAPEKLVALARAHWLTERKY